MGLGSNLAKVTLDCLRPTIAKGTRTKTIGAKLVIVVVTVHSFAEDSLPFQKSSEGFIKVSWSGIGKRYTPHPQAVVLWSVVWVYAGCCE